MAAAWFVCLEAANHLQITTAVCWYCNFVAVAAPSSGHALCKVLGIIVIPTSKKMHNYPVGLLPQHALVSCCFLCIKCLTLLYLSTVKLSSSSDHTMFPSLFPTVELSLKVRFKQEKGHSESICSSLKEWLAEFHRCCRIQLTILLVFVMAIQKSASWNNSKNLVVLHEWLCLL